MGCLILVPITSQAATRSYRPRAGELPIHQGVYTAIHLTAERNLQIRPITPSRSLPPLPPPAEGAGDPKFLQPVISRNMHTAELSARAKRWVELHPSKGQIPAAKTGVRCSKFHSFAQRTKLNWRNTMPTAFTASTVPSCARRFHLMTLCTSQSVTDRASNSINT